MTSKHIGIGIIFLGTIMATAGGLYAQATPAKVRVLHEFFKPTPISATSQTGNNRPIRTKTREPGAPPALTLRTRDNEPVMKANGPVSDLSMANPQGQLNPNEASNSLDNETDRVDQLNYFSAFDPSVIPYKRVVAQNKVQLNASNDYAFVVNTGSLRNVPLDTKTKRANEDAFWGTFLVNVQSKPIPIPSVAPNQRIMKVLSEPSVDVTFKKDRAGNFYVSTSHKGLLRLNVYLAVPKTYFDGDFDENVAWSDLNQRYVPTMPARAYTRANEVLAALKISKKTQTPHAALLALVTHFRDFEGKPFPATLKGEDVYKSIALNKIGVCRHRSFAFVMTATALGMPTRYVYNEAHAFVEILWPKMGWRRIDLGGAAEDVLMRAAEQQQRVHDGGSKDPLPSPPAYTQETDRQTKSTEKQQEEAKKNAANAQDGPMSSDPNDPNNQSIDPNAPPSNDPFAPKDPEVVDTRDMTFSRIISANTTVRRGKTFKVVGSLRTSRGGMKAQSVRVVLVPVGANSISGARINVKATTNASGRFESEVTLPKNLPIGRWVLRAVYDGDETNKPSESR